MGFDQFAETTALVASAQLLPGSGTGQLQMGAASTFAQRWDSLIATNNDTIDHHLTLAWISPLGAFHIGSCVVPLGSGHGGVPSIDVMALALPASFQYLVFPPQNGLYVNVEEAINTGKEVIVFAQGGYF
jgi:hypothetical protein